MAFIIFGTEFSSGSGPAFQGMMALCMTGGDLASSFHLLHVGLSLSDFQTILKVAWLALAANALGFKDISVFFLEGA